MRSTLNHNFLFIYFIKYMIFVYFINISVQRDISHALKRVIKV